MGFGARADVPLIHLHPGVTGDVPTPGEQTVVFFVRWEQLAPLCGALAGSELDGE